MAYPHKHWLRELGRRPSHTLCRSSLQRPDHLLEEETQALGGQWHPQVTQLAWNTAGTKSQHLQFWNSFPLLPVGSKQLDLQSSHHKEKHRPCWRVDPYGPGLTRVHWKNIHHLKVKHCVLFRGLWGLKPRRHLSDSSGGLLQRGNIGAFAAMTKQSEHQKIAIKGNQISQVTEFSTISMYGKIQESGFTEIIPLICTLAIYGLPCWFSG